MWFVEYGKEANKIGRIEVKPPYKITEFPIPPKSEGPTRLVVGPDGNLWFGLAGSVDYLLGGTPGAIGRILIKPPHTVTVVSVPARTYSAGTVAVGPDKNIWFTEGPGQGAPSGSREKLLRVSPAEPGKITVYAEAPGFKYGHLVAGKDDDFWFTGQSTPDNGVVVGRFPVRDPSRARTYPVPGGGGPSYVAPTDLIPGPGGDFWFTNWTSVDHFSPSSPARIDQIAVYPQAIGLTVGPDKNIWYTSSNFGVAAANRLAVRYPNQVTAFPLTGVDPKAVTANHIATGPDGNLWITIVEAKGGAIARVEVKR